MASTKVRGITIELGADASGISKALSGVNKELSSTQKQLKDVERLLKLDPTNTDLLKQKQELLAKSVSDTSTKLEALKKAQEEVSKTMAETGEGKEQYDALTREIASTELQLKEAQQAASSFNATAAKISTTAANISDKFGTVAQKTKALSQAAAGALVGLGGMAIKAASDADELATMSKQTGIATDELQKMKYAAELVDVPVDTIVGGLKKLKKNLSSNTDAFDELGVKIKDDVTGNFRNITDIFYDSIEALGKIDNETERDITAMSLFGKSADELAGIIDDGGASLKAFGEEAANMGLIIPEEDIQRAAELDDAIEKLKAQATGTFAALGVEIAEMLMPYLPQIEEFLRGILEKIQALDPDTIGFAAKILAVVAAISPLASIISGVSGAVSALTGAMGALAAPIMAIVAAIGLVAAAFITLWNTNDEFRNHITQTWDEITAKFSGFADGIVQKLNSLGGDFESFTDVVSAIWNTWCESIAPILKNTFDAVVTIIEGALDIITGVFDVFAGLFTGNWEQMWNGVKEIFEGIWEVIKGVLVGGLNNMIGGVNALINGLNKIHVGDLQVNIPTIPTIALASGGVLSSGSAIVGEAGAEILTMQGGQATVTPLNNGNGAGNTGVLALLEEYLPYLAERQDIIMDSGALVGSIAPAMNNQIGSMTARGSYR